MINNKSSQRPSPCVLVLSSYAPSLISFRGEMLKAFVDRGCVVHAGAPEMPQDIKEQLESLGCKPFQVPMQRTGLNPMADLNSLWHLFRLCRSVKPDIFFGYTIKPVVYGNIAAWISGVPKRCALITGLGYSFGGVTAGRDGLVKKVARWLYRMAIRKTHLVLFQNGDDLNLFREQGFIKRQQTGIVNGSGVNLERFKPHPLPDKPVFLLIARLLVEKGIREFIEAGETVKRQLPASRFLIAGMLETGTSAILESEIKSWVEEGKVEFLGQLADVRPALAEASVFVLPSYYREGTPRTILEAMAMQRPVITCDAPGCREPVSDGDSGYLVPTKSVAELAKAMIRLGESQELRTSMGKRGREIVEDRYDVHKVNDSIIQFLEI